MLLLGLHPVVSGQVRLARWLCKGTNIPVLQYLLGFPRKLLVMSLDDTSIWQPHQDGVAWYHRVGRHNDSSADHAVVPDHHAIAYFTLGFEPIVVTNGFGLDDTSALKQVVVANSHGLRRR
ncbi:hypothetical protein H257_07817 [Aphanomyces astaci]|uniref:Uncharacterized protein n=1 Tax=Aphanomyces astaci TaxID=112090 RepID=W4GHC7_APHAT|nr:hypothetical protein H257_07817 [Aphanomyces astaci]ETV79052.1 hypothetical protein H257_07817 [Aphanomyces astaci]|eukprot:XP_009831771.1 hypothetical protein H257_07817 [Aphanomyces astaci]